MGEPMPNASQVPGAESIMILANEFGLYSEYITKEVYAGQASHIIRLASESSF